MYWIKVIFCVLSHHEVENERKSDSSEICDLNVTYRCWISYSWRDCNWNGPIIHFIVEFPCLIRASRSKRSVAAFLDSNSFEIFVVQGMITGEIVILSFKTIFTSHTYVIFRYKLDQLLLINQSRFRSFTYDKKATKSSNAISKIIIEWDHFLGTRYFINMFTLQIWFCGNWINTLNGFLFSVAIGLIVQHIRELLNYRNGNGLQQQRDRQLAQQQQQLQQQQSQTEENGKRNRHNSDSFFTRPH